MNNTIPNFSFKHARDLKSSNAGYKLISYNKFQTTLDEQYRLEGLSRSFRIFVENDTKCKNMWIPELENFMI